MCESGTCANEAEFLVDQGFKRIRAVCEKHLKAIGVSDADIPPPCSRRRSPMISSQHWSAIAA
jgi:hypothetical protein